MNSDDLLTTFRSEIPLPDETRARRIYARATTRSRRLPRRRVALAVAVCVAIGASAVAFSGLLESQQQTAPQTRIPRGGGRPMGYEPMTLAFTRGSQGVTAIDVTVRAAIRDATLRLQVLRTQDLNCPGCSGTEQQVVFQEQVGPMTNFSSPAEGPPGVVALSTWSGTLSPSDWDGGCQSGLYTVSATVVPSGTAFPDGTSSSALPSGSEGTEGPWFACTPSSG